MARGPDRAQNVSFAELRAMLKEIERIRDAFADALTLEEATGEICTYNYKSGAVAIQSLGSFANALTDASFRFRSGRPYKPDELKPRSVAKVKSPSEVEAIIEVHRKTVKKTKKKT